METKTRVFELSVNPSSIPMSVIAIYTIRGNLPEVIYTFVLHTSTAASSCQPNFWLQDAITIALDINWCKPESNMY